MINENLRWHLLPLIIAFLILASLALALIFKAFIYFPVVLGVLSMAFLPDAKNDMQSMSRPSFEEALEEWRTMQD